MKTYLKQISLLLIFISAITYAQPPQGKRDKVKSLKIAFISDELALTPQEAEKFWPIYNKYDGKIMDLKEAQMKLRHQRRNGTDEEALKIIVEAEEKEAEVMAFFGVARKVATSINSRPE